MAASVYIQGAVEQEEYGIADATPVQIMRASSLVDHYLRRTKGCVWAPDSLGRPTYMTGANPTITYSCTTLISPGTSVVVPITSILGADDSLIGDVLILDRQNFSRVEACIVQEVKAGQIILTSVLRPHDGTATPLLMERGLVIEEEKSLPSQRSITKLSEWPIANLLSAVGRYAYGRRSDQTFGTGYDANLLSSLSAFGGPPAWAPFSVPASSLNPSSGDFWVPSGSLLSYYSDVKARYVAGWPQGSLPSEIKIATATVVERIQDAPMGPMVRRFSTGKVSIERFADTVLDPDTKSMLRPYMANWMV
jgi:hypothetical protein